MLLGPCSRMRSVRRELEGVQVLEDVDERTQRQRMPNTGRDEGGDTGRDEGANTGYDVCQNTERDEGANTGCNLCVNTGTATKRTATNGSLY